MAAAYLPDVGHHGVVHFIHASGYGAQQSATAYHGVKFYRDVVFGQGGEDEIFAEVKLVDDFGIGFKIVDTVADGCGKHFFVVVEHGNFCGC